MPMFSFFKRSKPVRSVIDGATVEALLSLSLNGRKAQRYRHIPTKAETSVVTMADVEKAATKASKPWLKDRWECEDIARDMVNEAQKIAANEGRSWALGILRARAPHNLDALHVYVFAVVIREGRFADRDVVFYDPTARLWTSAANLQEVDFTLI